MSIVTIVSRKRKAITHDALVEAALFDQFGKNLSNAPDADIKNRFSSHNDKIVSNLQPQNESGDGDRDDSEDDGDLEDEDEEQEEDHDSGDINIRTAPIRTTLDANGNSRYVYAEIDPVYDSDDSDAPQSTNTIGNIPTSFYDSYPHIGYDIDGRKIVRPAQGAALDSLLDSIDIPKGWTGLTDPATGRPLELDDDELDVLRRITQNKFVNDAHDFYPDTVEYFSARTEQMPLSAAPEPKRRFVPSKHEAKMVMRLVRAIREGRIQPYRPDKDKEDDDDEALNHAIYDIWKDEGRKNDHPMNVAAPKLPPPGYAESYHPPPEYVPEEDERLAWLQSDEGEKKNGFLPANHDALRKVPGYDLFLKEKFERCLDLYLAPRIRRSKLQIDPESLLPKLPRPEELRPFPGRCDLVICASTRRVRGLAIDPQGLLLATGDDSGALKIWSLSSGRQVWNLRLSDQEPVSAVKWRPGTQTSILAAASGDDIFFAAPHLSSLLGHDADAAAANRALLTNGWSFPELVRSDADGRSVARWLRPQPHLQEKGVLLQLRMPSAVRTISWHRRGDYFATLSPQGQSRAIAIHTLSKHLTQLPFRRLKGLPQHIQFHPSKPVFFVATQRTIRSYDLTKQELLKTLSPGARWISNFDIHPGGDNVIVSSFDKKLLWMDMDLSVRPYKTLRYHVKAIRSARFHQGGYPLFADCSDDGSLQIFHGKVFGDMMENASIVPLKVLNGHTVETGLGVLDVDWHPVDPWIVSTGADGFCRVWRP